MGRPAGSVVRLAYVQRFMDRHGKERFYFRKGGYRVALPGKPGEEAFMLAYTKAFEIAGSAKNSARGEPGTFARLVGEYYLSTEYKRLKEMTRKNYKRILDKFCEAHGHRRVDQMKREHISLIMGAMSDRPGAARNLLKRIRTVLRFAIDLGWITSDPTYKMKTYRSNEFHTWTEDEIEQFENRWPVGTKQRLAFALHLYTGQRRSDVHRMTWPDIKDGYINVVQQKTGARLEIRLHPALLDILQQTERKHICILVTEYGKPFSVAGYGQWMSDAINAANLPERCKTHGLRKAAARRLAESGCTALEIASITGHKSLAEVERYTREANKKMLSGAAIEKQTKNG